MKHEYGCNNTTIPYISLFSGYEGIGLGLYRIFGRNIRTIGYCEREAFAIENLVDKIETEQLDAAPIFTDVHTFPWEQYAPFMAHGIVSFGFPCQPVSVAGKRRSTEDERWLFDVCADGFAIMRPGILFAENVEGLLSAKKPNGLPVIAHIFERLEAIGYKVEAGIFSAAEVGAPHQRKRVFILANRNGIDGSTQAIGRFHDGEAGYSSEAMAYARRYERRENESGRGQEGRASVERDGETVADHTSDRRGAWRPESERQQGRSGSSGGCSDVAHGDFQGLEGRDCGKLRERAEQLSSGAGGSQTLWPSRPGEPQYEWEEPRTLDGKLNPDWVESLQGIPKGWTQLTNALHGENRIDRLRLLGNGVVPATAEKAFITLLNRIKKTGINREKVETQMELF